MKSKAENYISHDASRVHATQPATSLPWQPKSPHDPARLRDRGPPYFRRVLTLSSRHPGGRAKMPRYPRSRACAQLNAPLDSLAFSSFPPQPGRGRRGRAAAGTFRERNPGRELLVEKKLWVCSACNLCLDGQESVGTTFEPVGSVTSR